MLNKAKVLQELQAHVDKLFLDIGPEYTLARSSWERLAHDPLFYQKVLSHPLPWQIPLWQGDLGVAHAVPRYQEPYTVVGIDGSQIYPDKHQGTSCALVNIGIVEISYGTQTAHVVLNSKPHVIVPHDDETLPEYSVDTINGYRQELEFLAAYEHCTTVAKAGGETRPQKKMVLYDGSLIFWHLASKDPTIKNTFLTSYLDSLQLLYEARIPIAGYISMPKSKDLVNMIRAELCNFQPTISDEYKKVEHLVDSHIATFFLEPYQRSQLFQSVHPITKHYPTHLQPYFFYVHNGIELVRGEVPAWIALDTPLLDYVASIMLDQAIKGQGYPVVLAEAHEQAVVKGPDREYFYHIIQKLGIEQRRHITLSPKSLKKRGIGI
jgi:hypothetical protein